MPIRVLLMSGSMEGGGSERQTALLLRHLDRRQFAPELFLRYRRGELLAELPDDVPVHAFDDPPRRMSVNWPGRWHGRIVRYVRDLIAQRKIDVVYDRTFHMTLVAGPAARGRAARVSTIVSPPEKILPQLEPRFLEVKRRRLAAAYRRSHVVLAVSEAVRQSALRYYGLSAESIHTLRSPVDLTRLRSLAAPAPGLDFDPSAIHIACVGRMTREKGQDVLIDALAQLRDPRLVLWMVGEGPLRGALQRRAREAGVAGQVRFIGHLNNAPAVVARCAALVCPSRYEGLPNVVLEAFGLGVPVIASDAGGIGEIVTAGQTGRLVPADDAAALAAALEGLVASPAEFRSMAAEAQSLVERRYAVEPYVEQLQSWLTSAATSRTSRRD